ncbi:unnamed protein product [Rotaria magnacalcarata]|uniref:F-box domain-containing protein n=1 Tax=Rotaria magnacalcarata TaxID=392030 RepID=A0A8S2NFD2_9BILA|nr:unnamed protein product [Rotaria magnacalcarata]
MSRDVTSSLLTLPVELIYRILDNLDDFTFLCSTRNVCQRLNYITDAYHRYQTLTTLDLSEYQIKDQGTQHLAHALTNNTIISAIDLTNNKIHDQGIAYLTAALKNNTTLTKLNLQCNSIEDQGAKYLVDILLNNTVLHDQQIFVLSIFILHPGIDDTQP